MNNKEILNNILKIRDIRNNLSTLNLNDKEKEILRKALNYYEDSLNLDITRNNLNKNEFTEYGINNDIEEVIVPVEENTNRYHEFALVQDNEIISIITNISDNINNIDLDTNYIILILKSLKEYSEYLKSLEVTKKSNQELYTEIMPDNNSDLKK